MSCRIARRSALLLCVGLMTATLLTSQARAVNNGDVPVNTVESARRVIEDLHSEYGDRYARGKEFLERLGQIEAKLKENKDDKDANTDLQALIREATLAN
ncbi:MAG: hypothetical protein HQ581_10190, partial [Planctomycetes bacterium]|nr:hypothetical protein [Planctomycetota bacterium]